MAMTCSECGNLSRQLAGIHDGITISWPVTIDGLRTASDVGCKFCHQLMNYDPMWPKVSEYDVMILTVSLLGRRSHRDPEYEKIVVTSPHGIQLWFYVCVYEDDPAGLDFETRPLRLDVGSSDAFIQIKRWLSICQETHSDCPKDNQNSYLPRRVIDVGHYHGCVDPYLYDTSRGERGSYVALSYCWGGPQPLTTTTQTLATFSENIPLTYLPKTLQDAVFVTRGLGVRYLWIDALCIVQDSEDDKAEQIQNMAKIYHQAYLTISAASAARCQDGFLTTRHASPFTGSITLPYICRDGRLGTLYLRISPQWPDDGHVISTRAWTFQERFLSPRTIFYGKRLSWHCQSTVEFFDREDGGNGTSPFISGADWRLKNDIFKAPSKSVGVSEASLAKDWHLLIKTYMIRKMSDPHDKLSAVAGIASQFQQITGDTYLAGLWKSDLAAHLAWRAAPDLGWYCGRAPTAPSPVHRAPSWSWASLDGFVQWDNTTSKTRGTQACEILDVQVQLFNTSAPLGRVTSGLLTIRAHCKELVLSMLDAPVQCLAEQASFSHTVAAFQASAADHPQFHCTDKSRLVAWLGENDPPIAICILDISDKPCHGPIIEPSDPPSRVVTCLPLFRKKDNQTDGLVLRKVENGVYERIGLFIDCANDWFPSGSACSTVTII